MANYRQEFWEALDRLVAACPLVIDRPKGSIHPHFPDMIYPLDYGYLDGTRAMDGGGVDVWVGSLKPPLLDAVITTVDSKKRDVELKLLLGCSQAEKEIILAFTAGDSMRANLWPRSPEPLDWIKTRRSVRRFLPRPVDPEVLEQILEAATWAPSSHNRQPWRFAVLTTPASKAALAAAMGAEFHKDLLSGGLTPEEAYEQVERSRQRIEQAPVAIVLCCDLTVGDVYPDSRRQQAEYLMEVQSLAMAGENLLLAAHTQGLGGVWVCAPLFVPVIVRQALNLPQDWEPQGLLLIGYPARMPAPRPRRPVAEVTVFL